MELQLKHLHVTIMLLYFQLVGVAFLQLPYIPHSTDAYNGGEPGGELVPAQGVAGVHGAHDLNILQPHPLQVAVIEPIVGHHLHHTALD